MDLNYNYNEFKEEYTKLINENYYKSGKYTPFIEDALLEDKYPTWVYKILGEHGYINVWTARSNISFYIHADTIEKKWIVFTSRGIAFDINEGNHPECIDTQVFIEIIFNRRRDLFIDLYISALKLDDLEVPLAEIYLEEFNKYFNKLTSEEQLYIELRR